MSSRISCLRMALIESGSSAIMKLVTSSSTTCVSTTRTTRRNKVDSQPDMIHASGANMNKENRIRFSADLRFTDRDGKYDPRWDK